MNTFSNIILFAFTFTSIAASAFRLDPMVSEFSTTGQNKSKIFRIENNGGERVAVKIEMTTREVNPDGKENRVPVKDFSIYPEQVSLGPNDTRNIRVTYQGQEVSSEKSYRLIASQLPVDFKAEKKQNQLNFLFQYVASIYVTPEKAQSKIEVTRIHSTAAHKIALTLENKGTAHRLLKEVRLNVTTDKNKSISIPESSYKDWDSENILAGGTRVFELTTTEDVPSKTTLKGKVKNSNEASAK